MNQIEKRIKPIQVEITRSAWGDALNQLAKASGLSEEQVADAAAKGAVWRKKAKAHKLRRIRNLVDTTEAADKLYLNYDADVLAQQALVPVLVSDQLNYSVWNKPAGMLSQGSKWSDHCTITEVVGVLHGKPTLLVHRLDKAASGLIVVAHTKNALQKLATLFAERKVEKHYSVTVHGKYSDSIPKQLDTPIEGKMAATRILEASYDETTDMSQLLVSISTGRKHQIRSHLNSIGMPVVGDRLFDPDRVHTADLQLTASYLAFECPFTKQAREFEL